MLKNVDLNMKNDFEISRSRAQNAKPQRDAEFVPYVVTCAICMCVCRSSAHLYYSTCTLGLQ